MLYGEFRVEKINIKDQSIISQVLYLLNQNDLSLDLSLEKIIGVFDGEKLIAVGGVKANTLRCIAVDRIYQGGKILNLLMSELIRIQYHRGINDIFLFTKPASKKSFEFMGFYVVEEIESHVVLMENKPDGLQNYLSKLSKYKVKGNIISSIVMNANPFTLGHRYLIEKASQESDHLHIFVLSSDESSFPYKVRMKLIKDGSKDIDNITIHEGGNYIISNATFPSYFIKEKSDVIRLHTKLDAKIFGRVIAPCLGINRRYIGQEPYCETTNRYNQTLKLILPKFKVDVREVPRKEANMGYISASKVRRAIERGEIENIKSIVPNSTYSFLISSEGNKVIEKIKESSQLRH
ncbi:[citrate (pro-3S)-lyase] ligase [Wukongibacter baidiensis]|uniref:[citrate (pro-3S)-lyase] ligase n=1 Tax=Wukongibacter baidiensis TaxID=1723361 RepID=UPI003D7F5F4C